MLNSRVIAHLLHKYDHAEDCDGLPAVRRSERISAKNRRGRKAFLLEAEEASDEDDDTSVLYDDCLDVGIDVTSESIEGFTGFEEAGDDSDSGFISENDDVDDSDASVFDDDGGVSEDVRESSVGKHRLAVYDSDDGVDVSEAEKESSACKRRRIGVIVVMIAMMVRMKEEVMLFHHRTSLLFRVLSVQLLGVR